MQVAIWLIVMIACVFVGRGLILSIASRRWRIAVTVLFCTAELVAIFTLDRDMPLAQSSWRSGGEALPLWLAYMERSSLALFFGAMSGFAERREKSLAASQ
ncbi:hypothetical protein DFR29_117122 [Tahibacter aquaticus]|uniref:Uncharacterized protein n=1 Tax=Tahibacter aquaticus TaxID=520092 RepID=A0A4R6YNM7_9GAMM|nr:hypothetical protein [Tahibacter aquaticus]TDR39212.1 hypothetical protein DFR29_117122 [Tahibacter aquaticus]